MLKYETPTPVRGYESPIFSKQPAATPASPSSQRREPLLWVLTLTIIAICGWYIVNYTEAWAR